jgi:hypothetical protein
MHCRCFIPSRDASMSLKLPSCSPRPPSASRSSPLEYLCLASSSHESDQPSMNPQRDAQQDLPFPVLDASVPVPTEGWSEATVGSTLFQEEQVGGHAHEKCAIQIPQGTHASMCTRSGTWKHIAPHHVDSPVCAGHLIESSPIPKHNLQSSPA